MSFQALAFPMIPLSVIRGEREPQRYKALQGALAGMGP